jgi:serine protease Do
MNYSFLRFAFFAAVGVASFFIVFQIRKLYNKENISERNQVSEKYTLSDKAPLAIDDVALLCRLNGEYEKITEAVVPSVVSVNTSEELVQDPYGRAVVRRLPKKGQGSGVIISAEGHIITNHHVIEGQQQLEVKLHDGKFYSAKLIGDDPMTDIAVLKINAPGPFRPLKLGDSDKVKVGQLVFAVGNPFGLGETITNGIISAKERSISDRQRDLFQTDAAINPGNSGGPLVNVQGEIVGINVAIFSSNSQNPGFQGVGFSIPVNDVKNVLEGILRRGSPVYGYIGVEMFGTPKNMSDKNEVSNFSCIIKKVAENSPAEKADLRPGDVVVGYNEEKIESVDGLISSVLRSKIGEEVLITIMRSDEKLVLKIIIGQYVQRENALEVKSTEGN